MRDAEWSQSSIGGEAAGGSLLSPLGRKGSVGSEARGHGGGREPQEGMEPMVYDIHHAELTPPL